MAGAAVASHHQQQGMLRCIRLHGNFTAAAVAATGDKNTALVCHRPVTFDLHTLHYSFKQELA